ncbi:GA module-containing protein, partial [Peptoniphilus timonensis]|uniref:GA module-containing protein n=1 Tax=Peptoniphilus timonensis TaxID=1268254 RepID=UPI000590AE9F
KQAKKLIDENNLLSKEDKEYYYNRLERAKTSLEVKKIIDEIADGGAESLAILMEKKENAKKELDKLSLRENSKNYYVRLIDSAVSLDEVDEILELAKDNPDGSKVLLDEKDIARKKIKEINNLSQEEKDKYLEDIYYAMEVRELDEIIKLANEKANENLDKAKEIAKKEVSELVNLNKENISQIMSDINDAKSIEKIEEIKDQARELDNNIKTENALKEEKEVFN